MNDKKLIKDFRNGFVFVHAVTIVLITLLEVSGYAVLLKSNVIAPGLGDFYVWQSVIVPIFVNLTSHIAARYLIFRSSISDNLKNAVIIYAALITSIVVAICHRDFIITSCAFIFPMVLSTIFNNRTLLNQSMQLTAVTYIIVSLILKHENKIDVIMNLNIVILFGFMFVSYLCSVISVRYSEKSLQIIKKQEYDNERLKDRISHDGMTGLYNHRAFYSIMEKAINAYHSDNIKICLAMIDIDDFKVINDTYGHDCGDLVIIALSDIMKEHCVGDKVCRYGGEEFGIIFLNKTIDEAHYTLKNIFDAFSKYNFDFTDQNLTFSCGISEYDGIKNKEEFFAEADRKLYKAKSEGKKKIVV